MNNASKAFASWLLALVVAVAVVLTLALAVVAAQPGGAAHPGRAYAHELAAEAPADVASLDFSAVSHGSVEVLSVKPIGGSAVTSIPRRAGADGIALDSGVLSAPAGATVTAKILPARGYQLLSTTAGRIELTADDGERNVGYYSFAMPSADATFKCRFTKSADVVEVDSAAVEAGSISGAGSAVACGTLELDVTDLERAKDVKALRRQAAKLGASAGDMVAAVDLSLYHIVNQGDEDMTWDAEVTSLPRPIKVSLRLSKRAALGARQFYAIREHGGSYQQASVVYEPLTRTVTFTTNSFSSYAIVRGEPSSDGRPSVASAIISGLSKRAYTGKAITPSPRVRVGGRKLVEGEDYTLGYRDNVNAGTATVVVKGVWKYTGKAVVTFRIAKAANPMKVRAEGVALSAARLKAKRAVVKAPVAVSGQKGKVAYENVSKRVRLKSLKVDRATGNVTVPNGTKAGTYKLKVRVTAAGNRNYRGASKTVAVVVRVR